MNRLINTCIVSYTEIKQSLISFIALSYGCMYKYSLCSYNIRIYLNGMITMIIDTRYQYDCVSVLQRFICAIKCWPCNRGVDSWGCK